MATTHLSADIAAETLTIPFDIQDEIQRGAWYNVLVENLHGRMAQEDGKVGDGTFDSAIAWLYRQVTWNNTESTLSYAAITQTSPLYRRINDSSVRPLGLPAFIYNHKNGLHLHYRNSDGEPCVVFIHGPLNVEDYRCYQVHVQYSHERPTKENPFVVWHNARPFGKPFHRKEDAIKLLDEMPFRGRVFMYLYDPHSQKMGTAGAEVYVKKTFFGEAWQYNHAITASMLILKGWEERGTHNFTPPLPSREAIASEDIMQMGGFPDRFTNQLGDVEVRRD